MPNPPLQVYSSSTFRPNRPRGAPMPSSGALERLRAGNQRTVLGLLAGEGPMSRADLVRASGLSRTTVSSLVAELIRGGQVTETDDRARPHKGGSGRPPGVVRPSAPAGAVAGGDGGPRPVRGAVAHPPRVR